MKITTRYVTPIGVPFEAEPFIAELKQSSGCCQKIITRPSDRLLTTILSLRGAGTAGITNVELEDLGCKDPATGIAELRSRWGYGIKSRSVTRANGGRWIWRFFLTLDKGHK